MRWEQEAKECGPELRIGHACQESAKAGLRDGEDRDGSHQCHLLEQSHRDLDVTTPLGDLKGMC